MKDRLSYDQIVPETSGMGLLHMNSKQETAFSSSVFVERHSADGLKGFCAHSISFGISILKPPAQLFELIKYDFKVGLRGRDRTTRLHLPLSAAHTPALTAELDSLEGMLKVAVVACFEARAAAYEDEVRCQTVNICKVC